METLDPHLAYLSNREVLDLLLEEQRTQASAISTLKEGRKKLEESHRSEAKRKLLPAWDERQEISRLLLPENVRSVQLQAIEFLEDNEFTVVRQTSQGIADLTSALGKFEPGLTKLEKLQLVNMAPAYEPEIMCMVDNFESRLGDRTESILELIRSHLVEAPVLPADGQDNKDEIKNEAALLAAKSRQEALDNAEEQANQEYMMEDEDMEDDDLVGAAGGKKGGGNADAELDEATNANE